MTMAYALLFLPGVFVHEGSHWLMAKILRVPTYKFSLVPEWISAGTLRFGYVEISKTDSIRGSIIGFAPLFSGSAIVLWIASNPFGLDLGPTIFQWEIIRNWFQSVYQTPNFGLWLYFLLTISNMMLPSASDRRAWLRAGLLLLAFSIALYFIGLGAVAGTWLKGPTLRIFSGLTQAFLISSLLDLLLLIPIVILEKSLKRARA
ncbi:MAG: hypothetical protein IIC78_11990 [Chloroflexi bacterium]|nr:hypothetical protein [Chloroflexota bacterium]